MNIETLRERLVELNEQGNALRAKASAEKRDITVEEEKQLTECLSEFERVSERIEQLSKLEAQGDKLRNGTGRKTQPEQPVVVEGDDRGNVQTARLSVAASTTGGSTVQRTITRNGGFSSLGEMAFHVARASGPGSGLDPRLERLAPTTFANEGSGGDGGYAVPADFRTSIMEKVLGEDSLLSRTDQIPVSGNTLTVPKDNGTPWGTTGIRAYWGSEGAQKTQSKPVLDTMTLRLHKIYALVPVSDELLEDATAMDAYIRRKAPEAINFAINLAIVQGTGTGQPLGILNSPALVTVTKEGSQVGDTILGRNITKMWSRLYAPNRQNAVWLVNQSIETEIAELGFPGRDGTGAVAAGWGSHVYIPPGGLSSGKYSTLYGRPMIPTQACNELGDKGDIILCDLSQYLTAIKSGVNPKVDVSIHLWFDYDVTAFRFVLRMTGQPWWSEPITPRDGNNTLSPFVTLEERAG